MARCLHQSRVWAVCCDLFLDDVGFGFPPLLPQSHLSRVRQLLAGESMVEELGYLPAPGGGGDEGESSRHPSGRPARELEVPGSSLGQIREARLHVC